MLPLSRLELSGLLCRAREQDGAPAPMAAFGSPPIREDHGITPSALLGTSSHQEADHRTHAKSKPLNIPYANT